MIDKNLLPHYIKVWRGDSFNPLVGPSMRAIDGIDFLPKIYDDWYAANDYVNRCPNDLCQILPYYPEYEEREKRYLERLIDREEDAKRRSIEEYDDKIKQLRNKLNQIPALESK